MAFIFASSCFLLESHAFQWQLQRGCLPVPHRGLCAVTLRLLPLEIGARVSLGGSTYSELGEPPVGLGGVPHLPIFCTFLLSLVFQSTLSLSLSLLLLALSLTKLDLRTTGPSPRTGMSQLAYQRLPQRSPDTVIECERRKQTP